MKFKLMRVQRTHTGAGGYTPRGSTLRRGFALMLVMMVLAGVTIMTSAALSTNDASAQAGKNAVSEAAAKWSAETAAQLSVAVLQTSYDFSASGGSLMSGGSVAGGSATVTVTNAFGQPPAATDHDLILTATSVVDGVAKTVKKLVSITPAASVDDAIDPYLGEYGLYAGSKLDVQKTTVSNWSLSPDVITAGPVAVGLGFTSTGSLNLHSTVLANSAIYTDVTASTTLASMTTSTTLSSGAGGQIMFNVPAAPELEPGAFSSLPVGSSSDVHVTSGSYIFSTQGSYKNIQVQNSGATATMGVTGAQTVFSCKDLQIQSDGVLTVLGDVSLLVTGNVQIQSGACITLGDAAATLKLYTMGDLQLDNGCIGVAPAVAQNGSRTPSVVTPYQDPSRIMVMAMPASAGGKSNPNYSLNNRAIALCDIHSPSAQFKLDNAAALIGRVTADQITSDNNSSILYDPALNNRVGFTNSSGPLYNSDGTPNSDVASALASFNPASGTAGLVTLAGSLTTALRAPLGIITGLLSGSSGDDGSGAAVADRTARITTTVPYVDPALNQ